MFTDIIQDTAEIINIDKREGIGICFLQMQHLAPSAGPRNLPSSV